MLESIWKCQINTYLFRELGGGKDDISEILSLRRFFVRVASANSVCPFLGVEGVGK